MNRFLSFFVLFLLTSTLIRSQYVHPANTLSDQRPATYTFINATIHVDFETIIDSGSMVINSNRIVAVGKNPVIKPQGIVVDLKGKHIYPSFIELISDFGIGEVKYPTGTKPQYETTKKGAYHSNLAIKPEIEAAKIFTYDAAKSKELRQIGFGTVLSANKDGIMRGSSCLVGLADKKENELVIVKKAAQHYSFSKGSSTQEYPSSLMGSIALIRQTLYDAQWHRQNMGKLNTNLALDALVADYDLPVIFETNNKLGIIRADKIGDEFGRQWIIKGGGDEYQRIDNLKASKASLIVPVNYPLAIDVEDPLEADYATLEDLKHWELAPKNLSILSNNNINFAITADGIKEKKEFLTNIKKAINAGLTEKSALKALTLTPAKLLNVDHLLGTLTTTKYANFLICSNTIFSENNIIYENWTLGEKHIINKMTENDFRGLYALKIGNNDSLELKISGKLEAPEASITKNSKKDTATFKVKLKYDNESINLIFDNQIDTIKGNIRLSGYLKNNTLKGVGLWPNGSNVTWQAVYKGELPVEVKKDSTKKDPKKEEFGRIIYPFMAFGCDSIPKAKNYIIKNVTAWTNEKEGIVGSLDVIIANGKILKIGKQLNEKELYPKLTFKIIDGTGKHLTSGIIDEHSHICINGGVNETGESVTAEVRIQDIINSEDVNIYRQLAGGVVISNILHGSANCIGGQAQTIKLRWGNVPEDLKMKESVPFIKFALGENVKQSNWGDKYSERYPQTRMGVEQVFIDIFIKAREYEKELQNFENAPNKLNLEVPRKNLELDAVLEVLNKKRFVTCHSYSQSEINMLLKVAEKFNFKINTFTHILEGYKVAEKLKKHGAGASSFSDWWAFKAEVKEAIPHNAAILHKMGVLTCINSDDPEMGRRLNQEAAKTIKYGGLSEEEAWKMVTLYPAKLLQIDKYTGSIKEGKSADLVLWSDNPLSVYAKAEKTMIDGVVYFDKEVDLNLQQFIKEERARIIQKLLAIKNKGEKTEKPNPKKPRHYHCDDLN